MNRASIHEYAARQRERYAQAAKKEKGRILDEVVAVTGYHRKAAVRLLGGRRRAPRKGKKRAPGRPVRYGAAVAQAAQVLHEAAGGIGAKRLGPFVPELAARLEAFGALQVEPRTGLLVRQASPATLERLLAPVRKASRLPMLSLTKPGTPLRTRIPVRTFGEWDDATPGFLEVDTVAHCGPTTEGFHLWTVTAVDIVTGWIELDVVWGKTQERVGAAIRRVRRRLPVPLRGLDCDNGTEFINRSLYTYCLENRITFTRSRAYRKNDNAHVEQKNGAVVRRLVGYARYMSPAAFAQLQRLYGLVRLHTNYFQPVRRLIAKSREGAHASRWYDQARTPYQRMLASGALGPAQAVVLEKLYRALNPLQLSRQVEAEAERLMQLAWRPGEPLTWAPLGNRTSEAQSTFR